MPAAPRADAAPTVTVEAPAAPAVALRLASSGVAEVATLPPVALVEKDDDDDEPKHLLPLPYDVMRRPRSQRTTPKV